jgi:hypothetical protein
MAVKKPVYKIVGLGIIISTLVILMNNNIVSVSVRATSDLGQSAFLQKRDGFLIYNNTDYGFQLLYPQDWTFIEGDTEPRDYLTDIVIFEPLDEKGKHYTEKRLCREVCLAISIQNSLVGDSTLQLFSDDVYNSLKAEFKTRDKYSDEMLPLVQTMLDSFKFTEIKK